MSSSSNGRAPDSSKIIGYPSIKNIDRTARPLERLSSVERAELCVDLLGRLNGPRRGGPIPSRFDGDVQGLQSPVDASFLAGLRIDVLWGGSHPFLTFQFACCRLSAATA